VQCRSRSPESRVLYDKCKQPGREADLTSSIAEAKNGGVTPPLPNMYPWHCSQTVTYVFCIINALLRQKMPDITHE
jgi:hypothetical protein